MSSAAMNRIFTYQRIFAAWHKAILWRVNWQSMASALEMQVWCEKHNRGAR